MTARHLHHKTTAEALAERMWELYVSDSSRYIYQRTNGYRHVHKPLTKHHLIEHVNGKRTIGVFADSTSRFITFDVDVKDSTGNYSNDIDLVARWITYKLVDTVRSTGIHHDNVHVSFSGSKGYHVDLFFNEAVPMDDIKLFHQLILRKGELTKEELTYLPASVDIELRPTRSNGVKLPLSINKKTSKPCHFVAQDNLSIALDADYIHSIKRMDVSTFNDVLDTLKNDVDLSAPPSVVVPHQDATPAIINTTTREQLKRFFAEGLTAYGTRHDVTFKLALYVKNVLVQDYENTLHIMLEWLDRQTMYTTPYNEAVKDTERIVLDVFVKNLQLNIGNTELSFTKDELFEILTSKQSTGKDTTPKQKTVMFAMLGHSKRYAVDTGSFYMTYDQLSDLTGITNRNLINIVTELEKMAYIEILQRNKKQSKNKSYPNVYRICANKKDAIPATEYVSHDYDMNTFNTLVQSAFTKDDLKNHLSYHQLRKLFN